MKQENKQLTSVKVDKDQFEEFKINSVKLKYSLQKLVDRSLYLYNTDLEFRKMITNTKLPD